MKPEKQEDSRKYLIFMGIGFELVGLIVGAAWLGNILDEKYHTKGIILAVLMVACLASWLFRVIWLLKRIEKSEENSKKKPLD